MVYRYITDVTSEDHRYVQCPPVTGLVYRNITDVTSKDHRYVQCPAVTGLVYRYITDVISEDYGYVQCPAVTPVWCTGTLQMSSVRTTGTLHVYIFTADHYMNVACSTVSPVRTAGDALCPPLSPMRRIPACCLSISVTIQDCR